MIWKLVFLTALGLVSSKDCYWNRKCDYDLFSTKTPYESVRGDLRDEILPDCTPISLWSIHRHGNRNPGLEVTTAINELQKKIISTFKNEFENIKTKSTSCSQDIEDLLNWSWNVTLDTTSNYLTGIGYEEIYDIGKRIRQKFPTLLSGSPDEFHFRPTNEQRTITSAIAFAHGLTFGTAANLSASIEEPGSKDYIIRSYENCPKYTEELKKGRMLAELDAFDSNPEVLAVRDRAQKHLGDSYILSVADTYNLYELCRYHRSWSPNLRSPWCLFFTREDLEVLEYRDDVRHYYRNGYGTRININLGSAPLSDLYENFEAATSNRGKNIVSYFTHDTMFEMVLSALGLYKDSEPLLGSSRNTKRIWRTSEISSFSTNLIAILYRCDQEGRETYRVQFLINEKLTPLCPKEGCSWEQFVNRFKVFRNHSVDFCFNKIHGVKPTSSAVSIWGMSIVMLLPVLLLI